MQQDYMCKIYSRKRIKFPKIFKYNGKRKERTKLKLVLTIILVIIIVAVAIIVKSVNPIFERICKDKAKAKATEITNKKATEVMDTHSYDEFFEIEKDSEGNIILISQNLIAINAIISDIAIKIQEELEEENKNIIKIPVGSLTGMNIFAGSGPNLEFEISSIGSIDTNVRSEFIAQGINQTLHRVYFEIYCTVSILAPFKTIEEEIINQVVLTENVILGKIPSTYYNFDNMSNSSDVLETIE